MEGGNVYGGSYPARDSNQFYEDPVCLGEDTEEDHYASDDCVIESYPCTLDTTCSTKLGFPVDNEPHLEVQVSLIIHSTRAKVCASCCEAYTSAREAPYNLSC